METLKWVKYEKIQFFYKTDLCGPLGPSSVMQKYLLLIDIVVTQVLPLIELRNLRTIALNKGLKLSTNCRINLKQICVGGT